MQLNELTAVGSQPQEGKLLVIDHDRELLGQVEQSFVDAAITVYTAASSHQGLRQLYAHRPDLILLDDQMAPVDGQPLLACIRELTTTPVILLADQTGLDDVIAALDQAVIDDYLTKPFPLKLAVARVKAFLRTRKPPTAFPAGTYADSHLLIDSAHQRVYVDNRLLHLSAAERKLLFHLFAHAGRVCTYADLLEQVWGWEYRESTQYVHVYISRLRHKLEPDPKNPRYLCTIHGIGYQFQK